MNRNEGSETRGNTRNGHTANCRLKSLLLSMRQRDFEIVWGDPTQTLHFGCKRFILRRIGKEARS